MLVKKLFTFPSILNMLFIFSILEFTLGQQRFAIIGDFGDYDNDELRVANLVKSWNPEFIITTGDNSYDITPIDDNIGYYYSNYIYPYVGSYGSTVLENKFWVTLGNHDYTDGGGITAHYNYFVLPNNERYYDKIIGEVHLFMLNSNTQEQDGTSSTSLQADWIKTKMEDCVQNHQHWRVVAFHHPPYSSGEHQSTSYMRWPFQLWGAHFVVSGHEHDYERIEISGLPYFVNGSGGRNLRAFSTIVTGSVFRDYADFGAQKVEIDETGTTMTIKFYHADGVLIDTRTIVDYSLPVELSLFTGQIVDNKILLEWSTATEVNNYGFEVERKVGSLQSTIGNYEKVGFVNGNGNSNSPKSYIYEDKEVTARKYSYRLKQIDNDGQFEYSKAIEVNFGAPKKFELCQNYPNPFNPVTTIRYSIPGSSIVKLTIFNIMGQEISILVNEFKEVGTHYVNFNASMLSSGIYFYKLEISGFNQIRKMLFIK